MRVEINLTLFFKDKGSESIDGFITISEMAEDEEILDAMGVFIEDAAHKHKFNFTSGMAYMLINEEEIYQVTFQNPEMQMEGTELCNIIIPDGVTVH